MSKQVDPERARLKKHLDAFRRDAEAIIGHPLPPKGTQAAVPGNFNPSRFLSNLSVILGGVAPFIPGPTGTILTAIDGVLSKLQVGGAGVAQADE